MNKRRERILQQMAATHNEAEANFKTHPDHLLTHTNLVADMDKLTEAELFAALHAEYERIHAAGEVGNGSRLDVILHHLLTRFNQLEAVVAKYQDDPRFCEYARDAAEYQALAEEAHAQLDWNRTEH